MNLFVVLLMKTVKILPLGLVRLIGRGAGAIIWWQQSRGAKVTQKNVALCFSDLNDAEQRSLAKASVDELGITLAEAMKVLAVEPAYIVNKIVAIENEALYQQALAAEEGLIIAAPHLGNWEVVGLYAASHGPMTSMYAPIKNATMDVLVKQSRQASGAQLVPTDVKGVRLLLKALKKGEQIGILPDQKPDLGSGEFSTFFNQHTYTMTLLNALQRKASAIVLMAWAERVKGGWHLHFQEPEEKIYSENQDEALQALNSSIEACVNRCPEQYQWEYKRFSLQPCGTNPYNVLNAK